MKKLMNKKGFTLMEMLIVVAIIVILVAISVPVFTSQLSNAKKATDDANERAAKGLATTMYLAEAITFDENATSATLYYDADKGILVDEKEDVLDETGEVGYGQHGDNEKKVVKVVITKATGEVTVSWE